MPVAFLFLCFVCVYFLVSAQLKGMRCRVEVPGYSKIQILQRMASYALPVVYNNLIYY